MPVYVTLPTSPAGTDEHMSELPLSTRLLMLVSPEPHTVGMLEARLLVLRDSWVRAASWDQAAGSTPLRRLLDMSSTLRPVRRDHSGGRVPYKALPRRSSFVKPVT